MIASKITCASCSKTMPRTSLLCNTCGIHHHKKCACKKATTATSSTSLKTRASPHVSTLDSARLEAARRSGGDKRLSREGPSGAPTSYNRTVRASAPSQCVRAVASTAGASSSALPSHCSAPPSTVINNCNTSLKNSFKKNSLLSPFNSNSAMPDSWVAISDKLDQALKLLGSLPAIEKAVGCLTNSFKEISDKIIAQSSLLEELRASRALLKTENDRLLKLNHALRCDILNRGDSNEQSVAHIPSTQDTQQQQIHTDDSNTHNTSLPDALTQISQSRVSPPFKTLATPEKSFAGIAESGVVSDEVIVTGIIDCTKVEADPVDIAFVILRSVSPSINKNNIVSARLHGQARNKGRARFRVAHNSTLPSQNSNNITHMGDGPNRLPTMLVRLTSSDLVREVMTAKHALTGFSTADLDLSLLDEGIVKHIVPKNIHISENLHQSVYESFAGLKVIAKNLGFKFVWHRHGRFLVKWREGERGFVFKTASDLEAILATVKSASNAIKPASIMKDGAQ